MSTPNTFFYSMETFHPFIRLPPEIKNMIWELHRQRGGIRHYLTESGQSVRHYAAIDLETNLSAETIITKGQAKRYWGPNNRPVRGESDAKIRLKGMNYVSTPGDFATSVVTANYTQNWRLVSAPCIRFNYKNDVVVLEGMYNCIIPAFKLRFRLPFFRVDLVGHWLNNVQLLAIHSSRVNVGVERTTAALPMLRHLYLLVDRDPDCVHGAPRNWPDFDTSLLEERKFLPFDHFVNLHPTSAGQPCDCDLDDYKSLEMQALFRGAFVHFDKPNVPITIVADPY
ncbi:hypothetical protein F4678DRAFT_462664 [Xylaria arbuscula]|nr:hypothetical protein F4678DRAFT_462664 [Xylaria arbuscula]